MGNSGHNKIYLGRRTALLNVKRLQVAASVSALVLLSAVSLLIAR